MECKPKDRKKIEQGKRLAEYNRGRREEFRRMEAERQKEDEELKASLVEFEKWKNSKDNTDGNDDDDTLTINVIAPEGNTKEPVTQSETSKSNTLIPLAALVVIGIGLSVYSFDLLSQKGSKKESGGEQQHTNTQRPKIISRLERI